MKTGRKVLSACFLSHGNKSGFNVFKKVHIMNF